MAGSPDAATAGPVDRVISLGDGLPAIPERLLLAHAQGRVLFIAGAGVSKPSKLPDFRELVLGVYEELDKMVHESLGNFVKFKVLDTAGLDNRQSAEARRFERGDYDVVLGMLERRMERQPGSASQVRKAIAKVLRVSEPKPSPIHRALMSLADRGGATTIITTNFDLLLQAAVAKKNKPRPETYALGGIPRPGRSVDFAGILHIHGALDRDSNRFSDLVVTDQDFGEFYLRRRTVPDLIYDAARLFHLVLIGYSANDPPMRYLLNAVAADGVRFDDLKERFTFVGSSSPDPIGAEDWKGRGITPITYDSKDDHAALAATLDRWAQLSAINGKPGLVNSTVKRIVKTTRNAASESDRDLFDHLVRRADNNERARLSAIASKNKAEMGWLDAILAVGAERVGAADV